MFASRMTAAKKAPLRTNIRLHSVVSEGPTEPEIMKWFQFIMKR